MLFPTVRQTFFDLVGEMSPTYTQVYTRRRFERSPSSALPSLTHSPSTLLTLLTTATSRPSLASYLLPVLAYIMCIRVVEKFPGCGCTYHVHGVDACAAYGRHPVTTRVVYVGLICARHMRRRAQQPQLDIRFHEREGSAMVDRRRYSYPLDLRLQSDLHQRHLQQRQQQRLRLCSSAPPAVSFSVSSQQIGRLDGREFQGVMSATGDKT